MVYAPTSEGPSPLDIIVALQVQSCDICSYCEEHFLALVNFEIFEHNPERHYASVAQHL